jgi:hypothetical protein
MLQLWQVIGLVVVAVLLVVLASRVRSAHRSAGPQNSLWFDVGGHGQHHDSHGTEGSSH